MSHRYQHRLRGPNRVRRDKELTIRLTDDELQRLRAVAARLGLPMADLVRLCLFVVGADVRAGDLLPRRERLDVRRADPVLLREVARMGNNLNQIARAANRQLLAGQSLDLISLLTTMAEIERHLGALSRQAQARS